MSTQISKRDLLTGFGAALFFCPSLTKIAYAFESEKYLFASAYMDGNKRYGLAIFDEDKKILGHYLLPDRGHGMAKSPNWLIVFARKPGNFAMAVCHNDSHEPILFKTPDNTHFYGHGAFSQDGKLLYATENKFESGEGVIGIYDATSNFTRIGEISSFGIGPHEIILMPDGYTLCVANGGILTHPDTGKQKLNLSSMQSSIAFIDTRIGKLISKLNVPANINKLSLRHMAVDSNGIVWLGGQYEGSFLDCVPLIAKADADSGLYFVDLEESDFASLRNYIGAVSFNQKSNEIAFTSPKGSSMIILDTNTDKLVKHYYQPGVCGVSAVHNHFVTTSMNDFKGPASQEHFWDNHIIKL